MKSHAAVAAVLLGSEELVKQVLHDIDSSSLTDAEKLLLHFLDKVNHDSPQISPEDIKPLHAAGWSDEAIWYGIRLRAVQLLQPLDRRDRRVRAVGRGAPRGW